MKIKIRFLIIFTILLTLYIMIAHDNRRSELLIDDIEALASGESTTGRCISGGGLKCNGQGNYTVYD